MLHYPYIDPVAFSIGGIKFYWYGMMYVIGFLSFLVLGNRRAANPIYGIKQEHISDIMFYGILGTVIGGRLGYVFFYNFEYLLNDWALVFRVWEGGMSFHGGLIGVVLSLWIFARRYGYEFLRITDFVAPMVPIGIAAGRIGNFINGELWGRPSDWPWAMVFSKVDSLPRHPSQLYEALLEGVVLFILLWIYSSKKRSLGVVSGLFAVAYAVLRFIAEFAREPDFHIGFVWGWMTMGQLFSIPLFVLGLIFIYAAGRAGPAQSKAQ